MKKIEFIGAEIVKRYRKAVKKDSNPMVYTKEDGNFKQYGIVEVKKPNVMVYDGKLDAKFRYAEIEVDVFFEEKERLVVIRDLRAFIDTGASCSAINEKIISSYLPSLKVEEKESYSGNTSFKTKSIKDISIRLNPLMLDQQFIPLEYIQTVNLINGFDVVIGNDILCMCEFFYDGLKQKYNLKLIPSESKQK